MRTKKLHLFLTMLLGISSLGAWADNHDFTVRPSLEKHIRFSYNTETSTGTFNSGYPKDYTSVTGTYELNYTSGMVVLQQYDLPSDIDWSKVGKVTIQSTVNSTQNGFAAYWIYDADATEATDATTFGKNAVASIGIVPKGSGTVNGDIMSSTSRTQIDDSHYVELAEITGDKLALLKEKVRSNQIAFIATRQGATSNTKKNLYSSNDANNTDAGDFRPVIYIDYYSVYNATTKTGYNSLNDALGDLSSTDTEDVLELNGDVTLDARRGPGNNKTLTLKPTKDGITLTRGKLAGNSIWFLTNNASQTLNIGCDEYQLIIDGENKTDNTNSLLGCEKGNMNVNNVKFVNFNYGTSGTLNKTGNNTLSLKNVTIEDSKTETAFLKCSGADKLTLAGSLNFNNCTGTHITATARIQLNDGENFTASTPIVLATSDSFNAGSLVIKCNNGAGAKNAAQYFVDAENNFIFVQNSTSGHNNEIVLAEGYTLYVTSAKAATFVLPYESAIPEGVKAYTLTYESGDKAIATEVTESIPANTPVLINAEEGYYQFKATDASAEEVTTPTSGCLVGAWTATEVPAGAYVLQNQDGNVGFYKVEECSTISIKANQAYLVTNKESESKYISIEFDSATGIQEILSTVNNENADIYTLSGIKVNKDNLIKGKVYITKGKAFMAK